MSLLLSLELVQDHQFVKPEGLDLIRAIEEAFSARLKESNLGQHMGNAGSVSVNGGGLKTYSVDYYGKQNPLSMMTTMIFRLTVHLPDSAYWFTPVKTPYWEPREATLLFRVEFLAKEGLMLEGMNRPLTYTEACRFGTSVAHELAIRLRQ